MKKRMFHLGDDVDGVEGDIVDERMNYIDHTCMLPELYLGKKGMSNAKFRFLHRGPRMMNRMKKEEDGFLFVVLFLF